MITLRKENSNDTNVIKHIMFRYLPYWHVFLLLVIICFAGAYAYLQIAKPVYESSAKLLIDDQKKGSQQSEAIESLDKVSSNKIIENESEVIQSRSLLQEVVNKLGLYASTFEETRFKDVPAYTISPVKVMVRDTDKIIQSKKIFFSVDDVKRTVNIGAKQYAIDEWNNTPYGTLKFIPNKDYILTKDTGKLYIELTPVKDVVNSITDNLTVSTSTKESSILDLKLKDEDPKRGKNILNELMTAYTLSVIKEKNTLAASTLNFIDNRLANVGHDLDSIESRVQGYKASQDAVDVDAQGQLYLQNVSENNQKLSDINTQIAVLNEVESYVQSKNNVEGIVPSTQGVNDPLLSQLLDRLYTAQTDYSNLKKTTGSDNPIVVSIKEQIDKLKPGIQENIQSRKNALLASKQNLSSTNNSYLGVLHTLPGKQRQLTDITRQQSIKNNLYDFLLQKKEESSLALLSNATGSKVIDKADYSNTPVSPNKKLAYISALLIAISIGIAIVMGKETFAQKIMFRQDIEILTKHPVIAEITSGKNLLKHDTKLLMVQQFRNLRIALAYFNINAEDRKRILITSAISGEGKSFVSANLAITLATTGKRVVLVDFDLNNTSLSKKLNIDQQLGISDYLLKKTSLQNIVVKVDLQENLYAVSAGTSANAAELITAERAQELLNYLDEHFDYVVIDSAPLAHISDAYMLSALCDTTLYVIRHNYTPKMLIRQVEENNTANNLKNVAIIFNDVHTRGYKNAYYGYGYSYPGLYKNKKENKKQIALLK